jgi:hypothetical protein
VRSRQTRHANNPPETVKRDSPALLTVRRQNGIRRSLAGFENRVTHGEDAMNKGLPTPEIVRRSVEEYFHRSAPALSLRWPASAAATEKLWELPDGVNILGTPPEHFGFHLQRVGRDSYAVRLLWNHTCLSWESLSRVELLSSALAPLLTALGTDLWCLLEEPMRGYQTVSRAA